ncbi:hypothetical protein ACWGIB_25965 [Streptomyces xiamenensis]
MKIPRTLALLGISAIAAVGCTKNADEDARAYSLPQELCGTQIDPESFDSVFPPGDTLETDAHITETGEQHTTATHNCVVTVDGGRAFSLSSIPATQAEGVAGYISERGFTLDTDNPEYTPTGSYEIFAWPHIAVGFSSCTESHLDSSGVGFIIDLGEEQKLKDVESLSTALESYMDGRISQIDPESCTFT